MAFFVSLHAELQQCKAQYPGTDPHDDRLQHRNACAKRCKFDKPPHKHGNTARNGHNDIGFRVRLKVAVPDTAIEKGEYNPTINLCRSICRVLGKTLDELFWEE